jgi:hypothetical protein
MILLHLPVAGFLDQERVIAAALVNDAVSRLVQLHLPGPARAFLIHMLTFRVR